MRYPSRLIALARDILHDNEEDWMPEGEEWEAKAVDLAERFDGAMDDCLYGLLAEMEREKAERDMAAAEGMAVR